MALFEDVIVGWGSGTLVGIGAVVAAPVLLPGVGAMLRPVAKGLIKSYFAITDAFGGGVTETKQAMVDHVAQVQTTRHSRSQAHRKAQTKHTRRHAKRPAPIRARAA